MSTLQLNDFLWLLQARWLLLNAALKAAAHLRAQRERCDGRDDVERALNSVTRVRCITQLHARHIPRCFVVDPNI